MPILSRDYYVTISSHNGSLEKPSHKLYKFKETFKSTQEAMAFGVRIVEERAPLNYTEVEIYGKDHEYCQSYYYNNKGGLFKVLKIRIDWLLID